MAEGVVKNVNSCSNPFSCHTSLDTQRGLFVGFSRKKVEFTTYVPDGGCIDRLNAQRRRIPLIVLMVVE
jgi:hypothetical protein